MRGWKSWAGVIASIVMLTAVGCQPSSPTEPQGRAPSLRAMVDSWAVVQTPVQPGSAPTEPLVIHGFIVCNDGPGLSRLVDVRASSGGDSSRTSASEITPIGWAAASTQVSLSTRTNGGHWSRRDFVEGRAASICNAVRRRAEAKKSALPPRSQRTRSHGWGHFGCSTALGSGPGRSRSRW